MKISILAGDPDYMSVRCVSWDEDETLMSVEREGKRLPNDFVPELRYIFRDPVREGVVRARLRMRYSESEAPLGAARRGFLSTAAQRPFGP